MRKLAPTAVRVWGARMTHVQRPLRGQEKPCAVGYKDNPQSPAWGWATHVERVAMTHELHASLWNHAAAVAVARSLRDVARDRPQKEKHALLIRIALRVKRQGFAVRISANRTTNLNSSTGNKRGRMDVCIPAHTLGCGGRSRRDRRARLQSSMRGDSARQPCMHVYACAPAGCLAAAVAAAAVLEATRRLYRLV